MPQSTHQKPLAGGGTDGGERAQEPAAGRGLTLGVWSSGWEGAKTPAPRKDVQGGSTEGMWGLVAEAQGAGSGSVFTLYLSVLLKLYPGTSVIN